MWLTAREALDKSVCKLEPRAPAVTGEMGSRHRAVPSAAILAPELTVSLFCRVWGARVRAGVTQMGEGG